VKRFDLTVDLLVDARIGRIEGVDLVHLQLEQKAMVRRYLAK
jgi:hypothetical protein